MQAKIFLILLLSIPAHLVAGQLAIIQDNDGYSNVRYEPWSKSEIIHKINAQTVFWFDTEWIAAAPDWVRVYIPKDPYSLAADSAELLEGFLHRSRLLPLEQLEKTTSGELEFEYVIEPFDPEYRIIGTDGDWITSLDGRPIWGTDGILPSTEVKSIRVIILDQPVEIHPVFYSDLFECSNDPVSYKQGKTYFVHSMHSDGAGYYEIVWVLNPNGLVQRLVGSPF